MSRPTHSISLPLVQGGDLMPVLSPKIINQKLRRTPISTSKTPANSREEKRKQRVTTQIEKELDREFDQVFTLWSGDGRNVSRTTLQTILQVISLRKEKSPQMICRTLNKALNGGDGKRQPAGGRKPTKPYFIGLATSLESTKPTSVDGDSLETPSPSSRSNRQHSHSRGLQGLEAVSAKTVGPNPRSIPLDDNRHQVDRNLGMGISPLVTLPPYKQAPYFIKCSSGAFPRIPTPPIERMRDTTSLLHQGSWPL